jgi:hypothetical protein
VSTGVRSRFYLFDGSCVISVTEANGRGRYSCSPTHTQIAMSFPTPPTLTVFTFNLGLVGELGGFRRSCVDPDDPVPS